jgi:hypothetical protein
MLTNIHLAGSLDQFMKEKLFGNTELMKRIQNFFKMKRSNAYKLISNII